MSLLRWTLCSAIAFSACLGVAHAQSYQRIGTIPIPGQPLEQFDISWVDPTTETYFLADRSNAALDIFNAATGTLVARVPGFAGFNKAKGTDVAGPDGVVVVGDEAWVGDGNSTVKVVDLNLNQVVDVVSTGGKKRADELAYDPRHHVIAIANDADSPPFISLISTVHTNRHVVKKIPFPAATNGIEQTVWNPNTGFFYTSIPQVGGYPDNGAIAVTDPVSGTVLTNFPVEKCQPAGLALGPNNTLFVGCGSASVVNKDPPQVLVLNAANGDLVDRFTSFGGADEVWFNPGDRNFYVAANGNPTGGVLGIVSTTSNSVVGTVPTSKGSHSVAADPVNNHVFVPLPANPSDPQCLAGCVGIYGLK
ncbi:hypothetical protein GCM10011611_10370 [Aliidongia dinghuensis]|uniref:YncE family protein n=1 Tax=Aliidongia dinghuensis TaxID=1867774 RepID=A0A8J3E215_9PROT|nr:cytochrome C nitrite reductase [Aliidongia dinghuensis]GGF06805.1 hypothetical protein GCM10011611_10370 [Aliidongia dinghuensis]